MFKLLARQFRLKLLEYELERLENEEGCLSIPCRKCKYIRCVNDHMYTCKREGILKKINSLR